MGSQRELLLVEAADTPLGGDHLGADELVHRLVPVPRPPPLAPHKRPLREPQRGCGPPGGEADGDLRHVLNTARDHQVLRARQHTLRGEVHGLLRRTALPVDRHPRHLLGQPRRQPARPRDVTGLRPHGVQAAEDDVLDGGRVDSAARDQSLQHMCPQVGGMHPAQATFTPPDGRTDRFDDVGLGHDNSQSDQVDPVRYGRSSAMSIQFGYVRTAIPSSTIDRYCRAISSGPCCPPGRYQDAATHTVSRTNR